MIKRSIGTCFLFGVVTTIMTAAPSITFSNFPGSQMELIPGSSPQFMQLLTSFCGPDAVEVLRPMLPYFVMVRNNSSSTIVQPTIRVTLKGYDGSVVTNTYSLKIGGSGVPPGELVLMTPISGLSVPMKQNARTPKLQNVDHRSDAIAEKVQRWDETSEVSISLDSVIFSDDSLIGPDLAGKLNEKNSERRVTRQLASELLERKPSERTAYLAAISNDLKAQQADVTDPRSQRRLLAVAFQGIIAATKGDEDAFRFRMTYIINNQTHELHRRNP
jgi:hypothetical protein